MQSNSKLDTKRSSTTDCGACYCESGPLGEGDIGSQGTQEDETKQRICTAISHAEESDRHFPQEAEMGENLGRAGPLRCNFFLGVHRK